MGSGEWGVGSGEWGVGSGGWGVGGGGTQQGFVGSPLTTVPRMPQNHGHGRDDVAWRRCANLRIGRSIRATEGRGVGALSLADA